MIKCNDLRVSDSILIEGFKKFSKEVPEFKQMYSRISEENAEACFRHLIFGIAFDRNEYDFFITNKENYNYFMKRYYFLYSKGVFNYLLGDNFDYVGEARDPFDCDFYNDNLEDR